MIAPPECWVRLSSDDEVLAYMKTIGLAAKSSTQISTLVYRGFYTKSPVRCSIVGYTTPTTAVVDISGELHCILSAHLRDMQSGLSTSSLPAEYVVFDVETTGFDAKSDSIIEIAAMRVKDGVECGSFESLIAPDCILPLDIQNLTGISPEELDDAPPALEVLREFYNFIGSTPLVGHNIINFDIPFLQRYFKLLGLKMTNKLIDTLKLSRAAYPEFPHHSLSYLKDALSIRVPASHRAMPDVSATAQLFILCSDKLLLDSASNASKKKGIAATEIESSDCDTAPKADS